MDTALTKFLLLITENERLVVVTAFKVLLHFLEHCGAVYLYVIVHEQHSALAVPNVFK